MLGTGGVWPDDGEIDIVEHVAQDGDRACARLAAAALKARARAGRLEKRIFFSTPACHARRQASA
jgi:hypothetical protein